MVSRRRVVLRAASAPPCDDSRTVPHDIAAMFANPRGNEELLRISGAAALAVGGEEFAARVIRARRKKMEMRAGLLFMDVSQLLSDPPALKRQTAWSEV